MSRSPAKQILIVDDETSIIKILERRLKAEGYGVHVFEDAESGLRFLLECQPLPPPDLLILDIMLPRMDGYDLCRFIKSHERLKTLPVILLSARAQMKDERMGFESGADAYVRKPFETQELLRQIKDLL